MKYRIVAVDYDDTLARDDYPYAGEPICQAFSVMSRFKQKGGKVILWTCRSGKDLAEAVELCSRTGLTFDAINENEPEHLKMWQDNHPEKSISPKVYADLYIDDKASGGLDWNKIDKLING